MKPEIEIRNVFSGRIKDASEAKAELDRIAKACKKQITPEDVVRNAELESSPLHQYFTWDDTDAARKYRLIQAGNLIRTIKVSVRTHPQSEPITVRAFVNVAVKQDADDCEDEDDYKSVYVPLETALKVDDYRTQMLENAARELGSFRRKYTVLRELSGVFSEIEKLQLKLGIAE